MFASSLYYDRDPLKLADVYSGLLFFLANAGLLVAIVLALWLILAPLVGQKRALRDTPSWARFGFKLAVILCAIAYVVYFAALILQNSAAGTGQYRRAIFRITDISKTLGGALALIAVLWPLTANLGRCRVGRIWALARLTFKEAVRSKVLWLCLSLLLVLLFAGWFIQAGEQKDQVRTYVKFVSFFMSIPLLLLAGLLAAFGIPTDMKQQTIHTILTKPVERFEVIAGRFLGYMMLLTVVLVVASGVSLGYVLRGIDPESAYESLKARETLYGELEYEGTKDRNQAVNVGNEWGYRSYIPGPAPGEPTVYALWKFTDVRGLTDRKKVRCEFGFDIYRTNKGNVNEGVLVTFIVQTAAFDPTQKQAYDNERRKERENVREPDRDKALAIKDEIDDRLAEKYGCYELATKTIDNLHTFDFDIPGGIFRHAASHPVSRPATPSSFSAERPPITVKVRCESRHQYVGVAKYDLYLRPDYDFGLSEEAAAKRDRLRFMWNYTKGQMGLWLRIALVVGLCVSISTCLSGLITFLSVCFIYLCGVLREFIKGIAEGTGVTGGPFEAGYRLALRDLGGPLDETTPFKFVSYSDDVYRWIVRLFINVLPDVDRFELSNNVAEGFSITGDRLGATALLLGCYVLVCAVAAYYLMKWREIASNM
jgi:hypothetical protein